MCNPSVVPLAGREYVYACVVQRGSTIEEGRDTAIFSPGRSPKQPFTRI